MANNLDDDPIGTDPTLAGGGEVDGGVTLTPGRAYSSVQCLALLSCCFLFLTYSVAIDGTVVTMIDCVLEDSRTYWGCGLVPYRGDPLIRWEVSVRK